MGRLGVAFNYEKIRRDGAGLVDKQTKFYGVANLYHEFKNGSQVRASGLDLYYKDDPTWVGLSLGGTHTYNNGKYCLYGEIGVRTSFKHFGDSYALRGEVGFRWNF